VIFNQIYRLKIKFSSTGDMGSLGGRSYGFLDTSLVTCHTWCRVNAECLRILEPQVTNSGSVHCI